MAQYVVIIDLKRMDYTLSRDVVIDRLAKLQQITANQGKKF
tara:strand:- start:1220 stop:1342 length:123 start_codon:yes stop_codon:yes gene_type:complete